MRKTKEFPIRISAEEYIEEIQKGNKLNKGLILSVLACVIMLILFMHFVIGVPFPLIQIGNTVISSVWIPIGFITLFATFALILNKDNEKTFYNTDVINEIFFEGSKMDGIYTDINSTDRRHQFFYDRNMNEYEVYAYIPFNIIFSLYPLKCKAYVKDNKAIVCEILGETKEYGYSENYTGIARKKKKEIIIGEEDN